MSGNEVNANGAEAKTDYKTTILAVALTIALGFVANLVDKESSDNITEVTQIKDFMNAQKDLNASLLEEVTKHKKEIDKLKESADNWRNAYIKEKLINLDLETKFKTQKTEAEALASFVEDMPFAAWIKVKNDNGIFIMTALNERFTATYGITKTMFLGKSDYEVFYNNLELAELYQIGDRRVADTGIPLREKINVPNIDGILIESEYIKFRINLPEGKTGVGGMIID